MSTELVPEMSVDLSDRIGQAVADALTRQAGAPIEVASGGDAADAETTALRIELTGGPVPAIIVLLPAESHWNGVGLYDVAAAVSVAASAVLSDVDGCSYETGTPVPLDAPDEGPVRMAARFTAGAAEGPPLQFHILVGATPEQGAGGGAPVAQPAATRPGVAPAAFPDLDPQPRRGAAQGLQVLSDVPMDVTVELGRTVLQVRDLLSLTEGSVVELDRDADAVVDVLVNGTLIARGDVVVIGEDLGVRITEIVDR